ncbi:MAG: hypothetical protein RXR82_03575 [Nitrososphaeria archaeon]
MSQSLFRSPDSFRAGTSPARAGRGGSRRPLSVARILAVSTAASR